MPRRFALALLTLLVLLLLALLGGRRLRTAQAGKRRGAVPTARPTPAIPPTPIPARRVTLFFEAASDEKFHPELRDVASALDEVAFLRSLSTAVLAGPRRPELLSPFPRGWQIRGTYRLKEGIAVLDLSPPAPSPPGPGAPSPAAPAPRWEAGSHEEESAAQALVLTIVKNLPDVNRVILLVSGEPAETLAGHLDLSHPLRPDSARVLEEVPPEPAPTPLPGPAETPSVPGATPAASGTPNPSGRPSKVRPGIPPKRVPRAVSPPRADSA